MLLNAVVKNVTTRKAVVYSREEIFLKKIFDSEQVTKSSRRYKNNINPKTAGGMAVGEINLTPPVIFRKMYLLQRG